MTLPGSSRWLVGGSVLIAILLGTVFHLSRTSDLAYRSALDRALLRTIAEGRPTIGRLSDFPYSEYSAQPAAVSGIGRASAFILELPPGSAERLRFEALIDIVDRRWTRAAETLETLERLSQSDFRFTNDLGVVYLEIGRSDRIYLALACGQFRKAIDLAPHSPEPQFNLALTYRMLALDIAARDAIEALGRLEQESEWLPELEETDAAIDYFASQSHSAVDAIPVLQGMEKIDSTWVTLKNLLLARQTTSPEPTEVPDDASVAGILIPLEGPNGARVQDARISIRHALEAISVDDVDAALEGLRHASQLLDGVNSPFDNLWLKLNESEVRVWLPEQDMAALRTSIDEVIAEADRYGFAWLSAGAKTLRGSVPHLAGTRLAAIQSLEDALQLYESIGAASDSYRPLLYYVTYLFHEGNIREAFDMVQQAIITFRQRSLPDSTKQVLLHNFLWTVGMANLPDGELSLAYLNEASQYAWTPRQIVEEHSRLAELNSRLGRLPEARRHLAIAEATANETSEGNTMRLFTLLTKADLQIRSGQVSAALPLLNEGSALLTDLGTTKESAIGAFTYRYPIALGGLYEALGRIEDAREQYAKAIAAVEGADSELSGMARLAFNEERRSIYETVIRFEVDQGATETALGYSHRYRFRLWDEALQPFGYMPTTSNPTTQTVPDGGRILEFVLLEDRLLIWVLSPEGHKEVSVTVDRALLESDIGTFVQLLKKQADIPSVQRMAKKLYSTLIEPVSSLLDGADWVAIVPDRVLHQLPFAALQDGTGRNFVERFLITQAPTSNYFESPPESSAGPVRLIALSSPDADPSMERELSGISQTYSGIETVRGFETTRGRFLDSLEGTNLFIYTGHSEEGTGSLSASISLNGPEPDRRITALEIASRNLAPNAVVVLSSCSSAVGNYVGGVEFRGLTSAFLAAGAGSVVGSLWPVASPETATLMLQFHERIQRGLAIAEALRQAQIEMIGQGLHPFYWAGFTVTGNRTALEPAHFLTDPTLTAGARPSL